MVHHRVEFSEYGSPDVLNYVEFIPRTPGPGEVRVINKAIGLNFIETYFREGLYKVPAFPSSLGTEGAGIIDSVGEGVTNFKVGDRVAYASGQMGSYSTAHVTSANFLVKLPDWLSFETAAAVLLKGLTVQYLIRQTHELKKGDTILFYAATGGVGQIALQWASHIGARVIAVVGGPEKAKRALELGAWASIDRKSENIPQRVLELTEGKKVDVVYDSVGAATWEDSLDSVKKRGLLVSFGNASGPVTNVNLGILNAKGSIFVTRPTLSHYADSPASLQAMADELFALIKEGVIKVDAGRQVPLQEVARAHRELGSGETMGSTVLIPPPVEAPQ